MSIPMRNVNQDGYVPPGYAPNAAPGNHNPGAQQPANYGFVPGQPQGYAPVPQVPYGADAGQPPYQEKPAYGGGSPYQPQYGGGPPQHYNGSGFQPGNQPPNAPIVTQPGAPMQPGSPPGPAGEWMSMPAAMPNCPRGLEYLATVDQLLIKQKVELLEAFTSYETKNKFAVKNALGQKVYYAMEDSDCCARNMCGSIRPFEMKIFDNFRNEVIHLNRPLACGACCFPCCLQKMEVSAPPGNVIGTIEQEWTFCAPAFSIKNQNGDTVLRIEGPVCTISMCGDVEFNIVTLSGEHIGKISKQWAGLAREFFTDADNFGINFPLDMDVSTKAVLLAATFLIDFMFFEDEN